LVKSSVGNILIDLSRFAIYFMGIFFIINHLRERYNLRLFEGFRT
jgi:hypothetical protein